MQRSGVPQLIRSGHAREGACEVYAVAEGRHALAHVPNDASAWVRRELGSTQMVGMEIE